MKYFGVFIVLVSLFSGGRALAESPVVNTKYGPVGGIITENVEAFLGIPYAAPPIGDLRWKQPQAPHPWDAQYPASDFGADCPQEPMRAPPGPGYSRQKNEDCLYLNIWRPIDTPTDKKLPVMVWIHGGAFIMGSSSYPSYDGATFAQDEIVFVSINYRLGRFGVFAHPELTKEQGNNPTANFGMQDQIFALKWVQENIGEFGGDSDNVTVFGESGGASSVNFLMSSPITQNLFRKAISQSGGFYLDMRTFSEAEQAGQAWAKSFGFPEEISMAGLRALPTEKVLLAPEPVKTPMPPVIDDWLLPMNLAKAFKTGHALDVDYLVGANSYEESLVVWLPGAAGKMLEKISDPVRDQLLNMYMSYGLDRDASIAKLWGEAAMVLPAMMRARDHSSQGRNVWLYHYAYVPETRRSDLPGAGHGAEIEMVFKNDKGMERHFWTEHDEHISDQMHAYWVNFAKTGNPNGDDLPDWPVFTSTTQQQLQITNDGITVESGYASERLALIESEIAPESAWD